MISDDMKTAAKQYKEFAKANGKKATFEGFKKFWNEVGPGPQNKSRDGEYYKTDRWLLDAWN